MKKLTMEFFPHIFELAWSQKISATGRHTDRHFVKIVISCSGHRKICKSVKKTEVKSFHKRLSSFI